MLSEAVPGLKGPADRVRHGDRSAHDDRPLAGDRVRERPRQRDEQKRTLEGLRSAAGLLQTQVARELGTRRTPVLTFEYDPAIERGVRLTKLIDDLAPADPMSNQTDMQAVVAALGENDRFVVTSHEAPDGDALGSLLGMGPRAARARQGRRHVPRRPRAAPRRVSVPRRREARASTGAAGGLRGARPRRGRLREQGPRGRRAGSSTPRGSRSTSTTTTTTRASAT